VDPTLTARDLTLFRSRTDRVPLQHVAGRNRSDERIQLMPVAVLQFMPRLRDIQVLTDHPIQKRLN